MERYSWLFLDFLLLDLDWLFLNMCISFWEGSRLIFSTVIFKDFSPNENNNLLFLVNQEKLSLFVKLDKISCPRVIRISERFRFDSYALYHLSTSWQRKDNRNRSTVNYSHKISMKWYNLCLDNYYETAEVNRQFTLNSKDEWVFW